MIPNSHHLQPQQQQNRRRSSTVSFPSHHHTTAEDDEHRQNDSINHHDHQSTPSLLPSPTATRGRKSSVTSNASTAPPFASQNSRSNSIFGLGGAFSNSFGLTTNNTNSSTALLHLHQFGNSMMSLSGSIPAHQNQYQRHQHFFQTTKIIEDQLISQLGLLPTILLRDPPNNEVFLEDCDKDEFDVHCFAAWNALFSFHNQQQIAIHNQLTGNSTTSTTTGAATQIMNRRTSTISPNFGGPHHHHQQHNDESSTTDESHTSHSNSMSLSAPSAVTSRSNSISHPLLLHNNINNNLLFGESMLTREEGLFLRDAAENSSSDNFTTSIPPSYFFLKQTLSRLQNLTPSLMNEEVNATTTATSTTSSTSSSSSSSASFLLPLQPRGNGGISSSSNHLFNKLFSQNNRQPRCAEIAALKEKFPTSSNASKSFISSATTTKTFKSTTLGAANRERDRSRLFSKFGTLPESGSRTCLLLCGNKNNNKNTKMEQGFSSAASFFYQNNNEDENNISSTSNNNISSSDSSSKSFSTLAQGYVRLVFTDAGPFFELAASNINWNLFRHHVLRGPAHHYHEHWYCGSDGDHNRSSSTQLEQENENEKVILAKIYNQFRDVKELRNPPAQTNNNNNNNINNINNDNHRLEGYGDFIPGRFYLDCKYVTKIEMPLGSSPSFNSMNNFKVLTPEGVYEQILDRASKLTSSSSSSFPASHFLSRGNRVVTTTASHRQSLSSFSSSSPTTKFSNNNNRHSSNSFVTAEREQAEQSVDQAMKFHKGLEQKALSTLFFNLVQGRFGGDGDGEGIQRIGTLFRFCQHDPETVKSLLIQLRLLDRCDEKPGGGLSEEVQSDLQMHLLRTATGHQFDGDLKRKEKLQEYAISYGGNATSLSERRMEQIANSMPQFLLIGDQQNHLFCDDWLFHRRAEIAACFKYCQNEFRQSSSITTETSTSHLSIIVNYQSDSVHLTKLADTRKKSQKELEQEEAERARQEEERLILEKDPEEILEEMMERRKKQKMIEKNIKDMQGIDDEDFSFGGITATDNENDTSSSTKRSNLVEKFRSKFQNSSTATATVTTATANVSDFTKDVSAQGVTAALAAANQKKQEMIRQRQLMQIKRQKMILMAKQKSKSLNVLLQEESRNRPFKFFLTFGEHQLLLDDDTKNVLNSFADNDSSTPQNRRNSSSSSSSSSRWSVLQQPDPNTNFTSHRFIPSRLIEGVFQIEWTSLESFLACIDRHYPLQEEEQDRVARQKREEQAKIRNFANDVFLTSVGRSSTSSASSTMGSAAKTSSGQKNSTKNSNKSSSSSQLQLTKTAKDFGYEFPGSLRWCARKWFWTKCPLVLTAEQHEKLAVANKNYHQNNARLMMLGRKKGNSENDGDDYDDSSRRSDQNHQYSAEKDDIYPGRFRFPSWWKLHFMESAQSCKEFRDRLHSHIQEYANKHVKKPAQSLGIDFAAQQQHEQTSAATNNNDEDYRFNPLLRRQRQQQQQQQHNMTTNNSKRRSMFASQQQETLEDLKPFAFLEQFFGDDVYSVEKNIVTAGTASSDENTRSLNNNSHQRKCDENNNNNNKISESSSSQPLSSPLIIQRSETLRPTEIVDELMRQHNNDGEASAVVHFNNNQNASNNHTDGDNNTKNIKNKTKINESGKFIILNHQPYQVSFAAVSHNRFTSSNAASRLAQSCAFSTVVHPKDFIRQLERYELLLKEQREKKKKRELEEEEQQRKIQQEQQEIDNDIEDEEEEEEEEDQRKDKSTTANSSRRSSAIAFSFLDQQESSREKEEHPGQRTNNSSRTSSRKQSFATHSNTPPRPRSSSLSTSLVPTTTTPPFFVLTLEDSSSVSTTTSSASVSSSSGSAGPFSGASPALDSMIAFCRGTLEISLKKDSPLFPHLSPLLHSCASPGAHWTILKINSLLAGENLVDIRAMRDMEKEEERLHEMEMEVDSFGIPIHDPATLRKKLAGLRRRPFSKTDIGIFIVKALYETVKMECCGSLSASAGENVVLIVEVNVDDEENDDVDEGEKDLKKHFNLNSLSHSRWFWKDVLGCQSFFPRILTSASSSSSSNKRRELMFHLFQ